MLLLLLSAFFKLAVWPVRAARQLGEATTLAARCVRSFEKRCASASSPLRIAQLAATERSIGGSALNASGQSLLLSDSPRAQCPRAFCAAERRRADGDRLWLFARLRHRNARTRAPDNELRIT